MVLKLKTVTDEPGIYRDCWFDSNFIIGFCITAGNELEEEGKNVNIFFPGDEITVKNEEHLQEFLMKRFVEPAVKPK